MRWHEKVKMSFSEKTANINSTINDKFPKAATTTTKAYSYIKEVWQETFPDPKSEALSKMEKRKEAARL